MIKRKFLLLTPLMLFACQTPEQKVAQMQKLSPEAVTMSAFVDTCIATFGMPQKIEEKIKQLKSFGIMVDAGESKVKKLQNNMRLYNDDIMSAWEFYEPIKGMNYDVVITKKHICSFEFKGVDKENMKTEFNRLKSIFASKSKVVDVNLNNSTLQVADSLSYKYTAPNTTIESQVSLITPTNAYPAYHLSFVPLTSHFKE